MENFITGEDRDRAQALLHPDEQLLWCGKYETSLFEPTCLFFYLFGGIFSSIPLYVLITERPEELSVCAFISLFVLIGWGVMIAAPVLHWRSVRRWLYILTNKRAVLLLHNKTHEYSLAPYMALRSHVPEKGLGKLVFELKEVRTSKGSKTVEIGFLRCRNVQEALSILEKQLDGLALESSKSAEIRQQEKDAHDMAIAKKPFILPELIAGLIVTSGLSIGSVCYILYCLCEDLNDSQRHSTFRLFDALGTPVVLLIFGIVFTSFLLSYLRAARRGRRLLDAAATCNKH